MYLLAIFINRSIDPVVYSDLVFSILIPYLYAIQTITLPYLTF